MFSSINVMMIGWGPHATRTYSKFFLKYKFEPRIFVDLDSQKERVQEELKKFGFNTLVFTIPDSERDKEKMSSNICLMFDKLCSTYEITHVIVASEPKSHYAYMDYFVDKEVHMLVEKPIVAPPEFYTLEDAAKARDQYYDILGRQNPKYQCKVMCQRKMNKGYMKVLDLAEQIVKQYNIPVTRVYVSHCDGNWIMPHDLFYENHPYKYGYGKLFHSGYHFVDLFADIVKVNGNLSRDKVPSTVKVNSHFQLEVDDVQVYRPDEVVAIFKQMGQEIPEFYDEKALPTDYSLFGEKAIASQFCFSNGNGKTMCLGNLYISQLGFSRRAWIKPHEDHYKNNGRVRHETVDIELGPFMDIQVHSYQSKEIKDRANDESIVGGLDHFDIYIFRNSEMIGGNPFEVITSETLMSDNKDGNIRGLNEDSREEFIFNFFSKTHSEKGELKDHRLAIEILYHICVQEILYKNGKNETLTFSLNNLI